jgi:amidophosphoribosyltransferase
MSDDLKHECAVAMVVLRKPTIAIGDFGGTKLSLLLEKQHNRGQDGAGAAILSSDPEPGESPYWIAKSASETPLADLLGMLTKRGSVETGFERVFLGHLRYATFGKNDVAFCHPFVHEASDLKHTLLLAGNFNLTNAHELFDDYRRHGSFPTSKADGYLVTSLIAQELENVSRAECIDSEKHPNVSTSSAGSVLSRAISTALKNADGAWTLCGATGDGWAFATRDPHGIRPGFYYVDDNVAVVASERPAIQAAFDVPPEAVKELPPGSMLVVSPEGDLKLENLFDSNTQTLQSSNNQTIKQSNNQTIPLPRPCSFERIYFSRANDADIHRERKALGAALLPRILEAAKSPLEDIFFSYIPNSARIAFHGLLEELIRTSLTQSRREAESAERNEDSASSAPLREINTPRFGEVAVKDAKFRTFIADAAARREFYKHVYDVTYGLVRPGLDTLVVLDDSIVRGNTMKNAILPMLDRLGPKRIVIASSAPPIRYPDCYGIDMSTLGELVAFRALVNLLGADAEKEFRNALAVEGSSLTGLTRLSGDMPPDSDDPVNLVNPVRNNPLEELYSHFTEEQHCREIARLLTPPGMKAEVVVVYQTVEGLRRCLGGENIGDWYFTGDYPTPGGYKVLRKALLNYLDKKSDRSY